MLTHIFSVCITSTCNYKSRPTATVNSRSKKTANFLNRRFEEIRRYNLIKDLGMIYEGIKSIFSWLA